MVSFLACFCMLAVITSLSFSSNPAGALDLGRLSAAVNPRLGSNAQRNFQDWRRMLEEVQNKTTADKLRRVNDFFNRRIRFGTDQEIWGQSDYWATPVETLSKGAGDCEDFAIAKYFTLLNLGIPVEQLRLVYVKARIGGAGSGVQQAHMVLAYYPSLEDEPVVLDNLITDIRPASRRMDLQPIFSFNSQAIWQGVGAGDQKGPGGISRLSRWQDLLNRARIEGFE